MGELWLPEQIMTWSNQTFGHLKVACRTMPTAATMEDGIRVCLYVGNAEYARHPKWPSPFVPSNKDGGPPLD